ncbi:EVE domain-containing protein [Hymenobacter psychrotolerans]|uniref:Predicted RNA-binding protein, contains PUA-like domain n=1 Tax=Hymenobacter psychrotolerans DSM 18569 TaxID=1121959 RepID=A0A1M6TJL3_9BACT|nr:EVE domain-containing protein [Hymenobacter psychrotolerans]SHK57124.1 Predicted RNA-binding protein, contains PUA-like domain [Hymenobacter psychrotolerans DSM 18569]
MNYWLVKSEPEAYSWADFLRDGGTDWTGVRNYQARNFLQQMQPGDLVLYYHSVSEKQVVGIAEVAAPAAPDATAEADSGWVAVHLKPQQALPQPVSLARIKQDERLGQIGLLRQSRLSVMPLKAAEFDTILELGA